MLDSDRTLSVDRPLFQALIHVDVDIWYILKQINILNHRYCFIMVIEWSAIWSEIMQMISM